MPTRAKGIKDFYQLAARIRDAKFFWFCFKLDKETKERYKEINFLVGLSNEDMKKKIKEEMDLMINCSHFEGFSLPVAEAILLEKPVISYKLPEIQQVYENNIEYVKCFNLKEYASKIENIIFKNDYSKNKKKAKNFILNNYSPQMVSQKLLKIILN